MNTQYLRAKLYRNAIPLALLLIGMLMSFAAGARSSRYGACSDCTLKGTPPLSAPFSGR